MKTHTIWDSEGWLGIYHDKCWRDEFVAEFYPEYLEDEEKLMELAIDQNWDYLDDEKINLNYPCTLVAVGKLGLWHGYYEGYMVADNLNKCFGMSGVDGEFSAHLYVEGLTLKGRFAHHDCPTGYTFTFYILDEKAPDSFKERLYDHDVNLTPSIIKRYFRSVGRKVKEIYGF